MARTRMAWESLPSTQRSIVRDALRPWQRQLGKAIDGDVKTLNSDLWQGTTPKSFVNRHDRVRDDLVSLLSTGSPELERSARDLLINKHNHNLEDANEQISLLKRGIQEGYTPDLQKLSMSVPQAEADEGLARAVLQLMDWKDVTTPKSLTTRATDIQGIYDGYDTLIDAQARTNRYGSLNLGVFSKLKANPKDLERRFAQLGPGTKLLDFLRTVRNESRRINPGSALEGKLFETSGSFNDAPSQRFMNNQEVLEKDGIITSYRPTVGRRVNPDHPRFQTNAAPFDPELPQGWDLMDLQEVRHELEKMKVGDMGRTAEEYGLFFNPRGGGTQINLRIPKTEVSRMTGNLGGVSPQALHYLTTPN